MDPQYKEYILSVCSALGGYEEYEDENGNLQSLYALGDECLECMKDIKRFIRYDDNTSEKYVLQALGEWRILQKDLVPILLLSSQDRSATKERIALACVELFVPLTWPVPDEDLLDEEKAGHAATLRKYLLGYKSAFLEKDVLQAVFKVLIPPLSIPYRERSERDETIIRLILTLFRNLVSIKDPEKSLSKEYIETSIQDALILRMRDTQILELLISFASSSDDNEFNSFNVLVQETLYYIFRGIDPKVLLREQDEKVVIENENTNDSTFQTLLRKEEIERRVRRKSAPSRHSRFGGSITMQLGNGQSFVLHKQESALQDVEMILDEVKHIDKRNHKPRELDRFSHVSRYSDQRALHCLRDMAQEFLESCFNPFFTSIRKDIDREASKMRKEDFPRFFALINFFLRYQLLAWQKMYIEKEKQKKVSKKATIDENGDTYVSRIGGNLTETMRRIDCDDNITTSILAEDNDATGLTIEDLAEVIDENESKIDFDLVATVMDVRSFMIVVKHMRIAAENKNWKEVQVTIDCFIQMLKTLDAMSQSSHEDYRDVSDNIQNNIYYEESTLELVIDLVKIYKKQSLGYLKSVIYMAHVLLKMLEKYSKSKRHMFVRKKKKAIKKNKADALETEGGNELLEEQDEELTTEEQRDRQQAYKEHLFQFEKFEQGFANEIIVNNYCILLESYMELEEEYLLQIVSMFHRIMVRCRNEVVFFRLSTLSLFNRILINIPRYPKNHAFKELAQFLNYCTRKFFKKLSEYPLLYVEVLLPKTRTEQLLLQCGDEDEGIDQTGSRRRENSVPILEVQRKLPWNQQVGVAVAVLMEDRKLDFVEWVIEQITLAVAKREADIAKKAMEFAEVNSEELINIPEQDTEENDINIVLEPKTEAIRTALNIDPKARLLCSLLRLQQELDGAITKWSIPKVTSTTELSDHIALLSGFIQEPLALNGRKASSLIRKKRKPYKKSSRLFIEQPEDKTSSSSDSDEEELHPDTYKSAEFILDSDEGDDEEFFRKEAELRKVQSDTIDKLLHKSDSIANGKRKRGQSQKQNNSGSDEEYERDSVGDFGQGKKEIMSRTSVKRRRLKKKQESSIDSNRSLSDHSQDDLVLGLHTDNSIYELGGMDEDES